jgi:REP element-mobilizing transposase RayT
MIWYLLKGAILTERTGDAIVDIEKITSIVAKKKILSDRENPVFVLKIYINEDHVHAIFNTEEEMKGVIAEIFKLSGHYR